VKAKYVQRLPQQLPQWLSLAHAAEVLDVSVGSLRKTIDRVARVVDGRIEAEVHGLNRPLTAQIAKFAEYQQIDTTNPRQRSFALASPSALPKSRDERPSQAPKVGSVVICQPCQPAEEGLLRQFGGRKAEQTVPRHCR
jgi:hypothetical protein